MEKKKQKQKVKKNIETSREDDNHIHSHTKLIFLQSYTEYHEIENHFKIEYLKLFLFHQL